MPAPAHTTSIIGQGFPTQRAAGGDPMGNGPLRSIACRSFHARNDMHRTSPGRLGPTPPRRDGALSGSPTMAAHAAPGTSGCELVADQPRAVPPWMRMPMPDGSVSAPPVRSRTWPA